MSSRVASNCHYGESKAGNCYSPHRGAGRVLRPEKMPREPRSRRSAPSTEQSRPTSLAEALDSYLKKSGFVKRLQQASVVEEWAELVGPQIASVTVAESVSPDGVLRILVATAPWANELSLMTPKILALVNRGRSGRIKEIRWVPGRLDRRRP